MQKRTIIVAIALLLQGIALMPQWCCAAQIVQADDWMAMTAAGDTTETLLPTLDEGPWLCCYYLLDSNDELASIPVKEWAGRCADETDWVQGWGPLGTRPARFLTPAWASTRQALMVRLSMGRSSGMPTDGMTTPTPVSPCRDGRRLCYARATMSWRSPCNAVQVGAT